MAQVNYHAREVTFKIVYYGTGVCGKTTNLQTVHDQLSPTVRSDLLALNTEGDRTIFFDLLDVDVGSVGGFKTKFALYTVPGQKTYAHSRKTILRGVDGVVFVSDSNPERATANVESFTDLVEHLSFYGVSIDQIPWVLQLNKRDLPEIMAAEDMIAAVNAQSVPVFESVATDGTNVMPTLKAIMKLVVENNSPRR